MATSPSPQLSPSMGAAPRLDRTHSDTPPTQPLSKRDKRRTQLIDRLHEITMQFNDNKDQYYRNQLQAIQIDTGLILHADPYREDPLNDTGDEIQELISKATGSNPHALIALTKGGVAAIAGKMYSEFANEVNDAMEARDAALTMHKREHERKLAELHNHNAFMMKLAEEEHKALAGSLRDRLINTVTGRKARLNKEKDDVLNIGESNALLLHPNQFTVTNPTSPGAMQGKRATRHRREIEDAPGFPESYKRKRKAADDIGSPAPTRRHLENGFSTPIWTTEQVARAANKGTGSPVYSIDKLFTARELEMTYNDAAKAAHIYIVHHKARKNNGSRSLNDSSDSNSTDGDAQNAGDADPDNEDSPPSAPLMDRQYSHATRSTRGTASLGIGNFTTSTGIDIISDLALPGNFARMAAQMPKMPPPLSGIMQKAYVKETANSPVGMGVEELQLDLQIIDRAQRINETTGMGRSLDLDREMLAVACAEPGKYATWLRSEAMENAVKEKDAAAKNTQRLGVAGAGAGAGAGDDGQGGVPMSKQSSMGGSEMGGVAMSRTGTGDGGSKRRRGA